MVLSLKGSQQYRLGIGFKARGFDPNGQFDPHFMALANVAHKGGANLAQGPPARSCFDHRDRFVAHGLQ